MTTAIADPTTQSIERIVPDVGIYEGVDNEIYHRQWDAFNKSGLDDIFEWSPMHHHYWKLNPRPETDALVVGSALHTLILEPEEYDKLYTVAGPCEGMLAKGGRCKNGGKFLRSGQWFCGVHDRGGEASTLKILTAEQDAMVKAMRDSILRNRVAAEFIASAGKNEVSHVWKDPETGVLCKCRIDMIRPEWDSCGDIKSTECARLEDFTKSISEYGYARQAAWYQDARRLLGQPFKHFAFIVIEKKAPYGVGLYRMLEEAIEAGREQNRKLLKVYANCKASGVWPSYGDGFQDISIANWEMRKMFYESKGE